MLILLACWTLVIKFIFPLAYDSAYGHPPGTHIYWDFWWVVHLWLAWALLHWQRYTVLLVTIVSIVEIIIIAVKFWYFFRAPDWTLWQTNWFINKVFVLGCFILLLAYVVLRRRSLERLTPDKSKQNKGDNSH